MIMSVSPVSNQVLLLLKIITNKEASKPPLTDAEERVIVVIPVDVTVMWV